MIVISDTILPCSTYNITYHITRPNIWITILFYKNKVKQKKSTYDTNFK